MDRALIAHLCRTSDRDSASMEGAAALGDLLGAKRVGSVGVPRTGTWQEDLRDCRGCLLEAGGQVDDAFEDGKVPILLSGNCSVCITTLPVVVRRHPEAFLLWLDAHGDFNTPETTPSDFLGGMCLSAACGVWDAGLGDGTAPLDPARVVMYGVRDVDGGEQVLLETHGVGRADRPGALADLLDGRKVFVHLDCDVVDPQIMPAKFPAPGGMDFDQLHRLLDLVAGAADLVGAEITSVHPDHADALADVVRPLL